MSAESEKLADFSGHDSTTEQTEVQKKGWKSLSKVCIVFFCGGMVKMGSKFECYKWTTSPIRGDK